MSTPTADDRPGPGSGDEAASDRIAVGHVVDAIGHRLARGGRCRKERDDGEDK